MKNIIFILLLFACSQAPKNSSHKRTECKHHLSIMAVDAVETYWIHFKDSNYFAVLRQTSNLCAKEFNYGWISNQNDTWKINGTNVNENSCSPCPPKLKVNNRIYLLINPLGKIFLEDETVDIVNFDTSYDRVLNQSLKEYKFVSISLSLAPEIPNAAIEKTLQKILEGNIRFMERHIGKKICDMTQVERNKIKELYKFSLDLHHSESVLHHLAPASELLHIHF